MNSTILLFFVSMTVLVLLSGLFFNGRSGKNQVVRYLGNGLAFIGLAFGVWTIGYMLGDGGDLKTTVSVGLVITLCGLLFLAMSSRSSKNGSTMALFVVLAIVIAVLRMYFPAAPYISETGYFFFNPQPIIAFLEAILILGVVLPVASSTGQLIGKKNGVWGSLHTLSLSAFAIGGVMLTVSTSEVFLYYVGWVMAVAILVEFTVSAKASY